MITTGNASTDYRYRAASGEGLDGVVRLSFSGNSASGALLFDGRAILTAAHLFAGRTGIASVLFETAVGAQTLTSSQILQHPGYDRQGNNDLALVWLSGAAPTAANRYSIYREGNEIGLAFTMVGYGKTGTGNAGVVASDGSSPMRLKAENQFDADAAVLKDFLGSAMSWTPARATQLIADFDNGSAANDALGQLINRSDLGLGPSEGMIASGDSGGPALIDGRIAGVASYVANLNLGSLWPDIDRSANSSFGEIGAWQRLSHYQQWIDQSLRANYPNPPSRPEEVKKEITEGDTGTSLVYFLIQFTGVRSDPNQILSVDYETVDGTARADSDYIATRGVLNLYSNENQAVIPVEVIGDSTPEPSENFYLKVLNPVGGSFGEGITQLVAVRTILDDDGWSG